MLRRIISAPVAVILLPVRVSRGVANMRFSTVLAIATGAAAAFTAPTAWSGAVARATDARR